MRFLEYVYVFCEYETVGEAMQQVLLRVRVRTRERDFAKELENFVGT